MDESKGLNRRQMLFVTAAALGLTTRLPKSASSVLKYLGLSEGIAHAQGVSELKTFSLEALRKLDALVGSKYPVSYADDGGSRVLTNGDKGVYIGVYAFTDANTKEKKLIITYPKDPNNRNGDNVEVDISLQKLYDYYVEACAAEGRKPKDNPLAKIMVDVDDAGATAWVTFVDEKPKPNDSSDLKAGLPLLGLRYRKESNDVSTGQAYRRIQDDTKIAKLSANR